MIDFDRLQASPIFVLGTLWKSHQDGLNWGLGTSHHSRSDVGEKSAGDISVQAEEEGHV